MATKTPVKKEIKLPKFPGANCEKCPYKEQRFVSHELKYDDPDYIALVEPPTKLEAGRGQLLTDNGGKILRQSLKQIDMDRTNFISSVPCLPLRDNEGEVKESLLNRARAACANHIHSLINKQNPKYVLALGEQSLKTTKIAGAKFSVMKENGMFHDSPVVTPKVQSLINPAYFLFDENINAFYDWTTAIEAGANNFEDPVPFPQIKIIKNAQQLRDLIKTIPKGANIAIDIETQGLQLFRKILCISISFGTDVGYVIPWASDIELKLNGRKRKYEVQVPEHRKEFYTEVKNFLEDQSYTWILQNAMFDIVYFMPYGIYMRIQHDTLLMSHILNEASINHGLKYQARIRLSWPDWDKRLYKYINEDEEKQKKSDFDWGTIPKHVLYRYAGWDAVATLHLYEILSKEMDEDDWKVYNRITIPALNMFAEVRYSGVTINALEAFKIADTYNEILAELDADIMGFASNYGIIGINPNSPKQVAELIFDKLGHERIDGDSLDKKKVVSRLPRIPVLENIQKYKEHNKELSSYVIGIVQFMYDDLRIHPFFKLTLKTGRGSTTGPSVLNIKKESIVRKMYIPTNKDYTIFEMDQSQCELRVLAGLTGSKQMIEAFSSGQDIHGYFAQKINPSMTPDQLKKGGYRTRTKNVVFGKVYRASLNVMAEQMMVSALNELKDNEPERFAEVTGNPQEFDAFFGGLLEQAAIIDKELSNLCPELSWYEQDCIDQLNNFGYVTGPTGRKRRVPFVTYQNKKHVENQVVNSPIQGAANDINWAGAIAVHNKYSKYEQPPVKLWWTIHDSLVGEIYKPYLDEVINDIVPMAQNAAQDLLGESHPKFLEVPFKVDIGIGKTWYDVEEIEVNRKGEINYDNAETNRIIESARLR